MTNQTGWSFIAPGVEILQQFHPSHSEDLADFDCSFALLRLAPGAEVPRHVTHQSETYFVLSGELSLRVASTDNVISAGESQMVPAGAEQSAVNSAAFEARVAVVLSPAWRPSEP